MIFRFVDYPILGLNLGFEISDICRRAVRRRSADAPCAVRALGHLDNHIIRDVVQCKRHPLPYRDKIRFLFARGVTACSANCARDRSYPDALEVIQIEHQSRAMRDREVLV
jgi:hypothetical protein